VEKHDHLLLLAVGVVIVNALSARTIASLRNGPSRWRNAIGGWRVVILTQLVYPPPMQTTGTALPVGTGESVEREFDLQLPCLMSWGRGWQPGHVAENGRLQFTDEISHRW